MREFEKGSQVIITGGAGYIGSCLAGEMLRDGKRVTHGNKIIVTLGLLLNE